MSRTGGKDTCKSAVLCPPMPFIFPRDTAVGQGALRRRCGKLSTDLVQEMPTFPAWPRSRRPLAKFSSAMGHSALGTSAVSRAFTSTQQGAAGKVRIWRLSFFRAATASLHLRTHQHIIIACAKGSPRDRCKHELRHH